MDFFESIKIRWARWNRRWGRPIQGYRWWGEVGPIDSSVWFLPPRRILRTSPFRFGFRHHHLDYHNDFHLHLHLDGYLRQYHWIRHLLIWQISLWPFPLSRHHRPTTTSTHHQPSIPSRSLTPTDRLTRRLTDPNTIFVVECLFFFVKHFQFPTCFNFLTVYGSIYPLSFFFLNLQYTVKQQNQFDSSILVWAKNSTSKNW